MQRPLPHDAATRIYIKPEQLQEALADALILEAALLGFGLPAASRCPPAPPRYGRFSDVPLDCTKPIGFLLGSWKSYGIGFSQEKGLKTRRVPASQVHAVLARPFQFPSMRSGFIFTETMTSHVVSIPAVNNSCIAT